MKTGHYLASVLLFGVVVSLLAGSITPEATILRIQDRIQAGDLAAAGSMVNAALKNDPHNGGLYNLRGVVHASHNETEPAEKDFELAVRFSPDLESAYLNLGRICLMSGSQNKQLLSRIVANYRSLSQRKPLSDQAQVQFGKLLAANGNFTESLKILDGLAMADRDDLDTLSVRSADLVALKRYPEARKVLEQQAALDPQNVDLLLELARLAREQNDLTGALGYLAHARELKPDAAPVHFFFGVVCIELDLPIEAKTSLEQALKLDPANPWYNYARGSVELQGRSAEEAIPYFQKAIAAHPTDPRYHFALGAAEFASGNYEEARKELTAIAEQKDTTGGAQYILGRISKTENAWAEAAGHFEKSIAAEPGYPNAHAELGLAQAHLNNLAGAKQEIDRALQLDPQDYAANFSLLYLYERTKNPLAANQREKMQKLELSRTGKQELMVRTIRVLR